jgi:hypothetical protein
MDWHGVSTWLHEWWPAIVSVAAVSYCLTLIRKVDEANDRLRVIAANLVWIRNRLGGENADIWQ